MGKRLAALVLCTAVPLVGAAPSAGAGTTVTITTSLTGAAVPTGGDPDATGSATLVLDKSAKTICYSMSWSNVDGTVTATHVHQAPAGQSGPHFADMFVGQMFAGTGSSSGCNTTTAAKISSIIKTPSQFYVNLHSTVYPAGAIRGQLG